MKISIINILVLLTFGNNISAQKLNFDFEPFDACFKYLSYFPLIAPLKPIQYINESEIEFSKRLTEYYENIEANNKYNLVQKQRVIADSLIYEECQLEYRKKLYDWRKRNPNWSKTARNKQPISENDIIERSKIGSDYIINSINANLRELPNKESRIISKLKKGDIVKLLNSDNNLWWEVSYGNSIGYIYSVNLIIDPNSGWEKVNYKTGATPECENVEPQYDISSKSYLRISVGNETDVVVKLMKKNGIIDECIRIVYVRGNESFDIENIPQGEYYLKIAYGRDYRQKIENSNCYVKFSKNPLYEKGNEILKFEKIKKPDEHIGNKIYHNWSYSTFELFLNVKNVKNQNRTFNSNDISEIEFNR